ncbi:hypothetical protein QQF64_016592 [Cirrhinus molitorella]|uniref:Uncharacterized protein n=1 Tax=Cirrhinus molitorella TaxID=172907 RepID=A0ABR3LNA2_9TELE
MKEYTDRRCSAQQPKIQVGTFVRIRKPGITKKGHSKFTQPFKVVAQKGSATYLLSDGKIWNAVHLAPAASCVTISDAASVAEDSFMPLEALQTPQMQVSPSCSLRPHRVRRAPVWSKDYVT